VGTPEQRVVEFELDGLQVTAPDDGSTLLQMLRGPLGVTSAKDGCSPQGQCGCCTVLVDGEPRVSCVTPGRRVAGRSVTTFEGLGEPAQQWCDALCTTGGSQCGFCTPGIVVRLDWLRRRGSLGDREAVDRTLAAHLCRCTGWQTIADAATAVSASTSGGAGHERRPMTAGRDMDRAAQRATIEGGVHQSVGPDIAAGAGGFADDTAPADALVAMLDPDGKWVVGESVAEAVALSGKVQGRRTTVESRPPLAVPDGEWDVTLATSWVEPGYLELDVAWCTPGGEPTGPLANGGAFGAKSASSLPASARELADRHGRPVVVRWSREDAVRLGPKRPPLAAGVRADGSGAVVVASTPGVAERIRSVAPGFSVTEVAVAGPPTSVALRASGWAEAAVLSAAAGGRNEVRSPTGAVASARVVGRRIEVEVDCGDPLDEVVLTSYCIGAAHMALGWVTSESLAVDDDGVIGDLTIRSFGIVRPADMPRVDVTITQSAAPPTCGSEAVFAAVALAVWRAQGYPPAWPTGIALAP
jgi:aerobic-type carbon monoxide dehydrogenase small subunit (CoxS/CutS family)